MEVKLFRINPIYYTKEYVSLLFITQLILRAPIGNIRHVKCMFHFLMLKNEEKKREPFLFYFTIFPSILYFSTHICFSLFDHSLPLSLPLNSYATNIATVQFSLFSSHHLPLLFLLEHQHWGCKYPSIAILQPKPLKIHYVRVCKLKKICKLWYYSQVEKNIYYFNILLCVKRKSKWERKREYNTFYYFIK